MKADVFIYSFRFVLFWNEYPEDACFPATRFQLSSPFSFELSPFTYEVPERSEWDEPPNTNHQLQATSYHPLSPFTFQLRSPRAQRVG